MNKGKLIKARRQQIGMTQKELAKGICTQATISKIEQSTLSPSSNLLKKISDRLNVSISYFYGENSSEVDNEEIKELIEDIDLALNKSENSKVLKLINKNKELIDSLFDLSYINYFKMVQAYLNYYLFNQKDQAIDELNLLLKEQKLEVSLEIDILCILGIIYYEEQKFKKAEWYYEQALLLFSDSIPFKTRARILYNYALNLEDLQQDKKAMNMITKGIELLTENQSMYSLGYFYSYKGYLFNKFNDLDEAIKSYEYSAMIFDILNYSEMYAFVRLNLSELLEKRKEHNCEKKN